MNGRYSYWPITGRLVSAGAALLLLSADANAATFRKGPYLFDVREGEATVRMELSEPGPVSVEVWQEGADAGRIRVESKESAPFHSVRVTGLRPATRYRYEVKGEGGTLVTAPASSRPVVFSVYGDNRTDHAAHGRVVHALKESRAEFFVHTGDYVENGADPEDWQHFFDMEGPLLRDRPLVGCVGNHELVEEKGRSFLRYFGPTDEQKGARLYGSYRYGNTRFFLLNAFHDWGGGEERAWLEQELSRTEHEDGTVWRVAVVHQGPWSSGPHGPSPKLLAANIPVLLSQHHIDLLLSGHDHLYERGDDGALRYIVSGGGGAPLYQRILPLRSTRKAEAVHHYVELTMGTASVQMVARRVDGTVLEQCGFEKKGTGWQCEGPPSLPLQVATKTPAPMPVGGADPHTSRCGCEVAGAPARVSWGTFILFLGVLRRRWRQSPRLAPAGFVLALASCATYKDELSRAHRAVDLAEYERALAMLRPLEPDAKHFDGALRAEYAFLRGIADYRMGYRADARHYLMLAEAEEKLMPGVLTEAAKSELGEALAELDEALHKGTIHRRTPRPRGAPFAGAE